MTDSEDILPEVHPGKSALHQKRSRVESTSTVRSQDNFPYYQTPQKTRYDLGGVEED